MLIPCLALIYVLSNAGIFFALLQLFDFLGAWLRQLKHTSRHCPQLA